MLLKELWKIPQGDSVWCQPWHPLLTGLGNIGLKPRLRVQLQPIKTNEDIGDKDQVQGRYGSRRRMMGVCRSATVQVWRCCLAPG